MNSRVEGNNINSEQAALALLQQVRFSGASSVFRSQRTKAMTEADAVAVTTND
jgi:hypothetical protein